MSRDELAALDGGKCILQLRGVRPFLSDKYDLTQHPNYNQGQRSRLSYQRADVSAPEGEYRGDRVRGL